MLHAYFAKCLTQTRILPHIVIKHFQPRTAGTFTIFKSKKPFRQPTRSIFPELGRWILRLSGQRVRRVSANLRAFETVRWPPRLLHGL